MALRSVLIALLLTACASPAARPNHQSVGGAEALTLIDAARSRPVPMLLYGKPSNGRTRPLAILSHGYGGHNSDYAFLAADLANRGYLVASIEHLERAGDPPMANTGDLARARRPVWQVGADSIGFVIAETTRRGLADPSKKALIIGHSNGGDMTMLFAAEHPEKVGVALSLDNRRMPLPRVRQPKICSVRSSDFPADPNVLPAQVEQQALGMVIVASPIKHGDMWDGATPAEKAFILRVVGNCIR